MSERLKEANEASHESLEQGRSERIAEIEKNIEKAAEKRGDSSAEKDAARHEALEIARKQEEEKAAAEQNQLESQPDKPLTNADIETSYKKTLTSVQDQLPKPSRAFSKVIHNPVVEKTSDAIGNTVARPNLIIAGALGAIASIIVYVIAKKYGYLLSGTETIALFVVGWVIGAIIEYARVGFLNKDQ